MDYSEDSGEKVFPPVSRARCHTWHAGLENLSCCGGAGSQSTSTSESTHAIPGAGVKRSSARRNAWGTASYADLIAAAIESSPDRRLTLSQIYDWMITNVRYFSDKADSNSSAGWKNSIRHNLSLHRRFVRVPHSDRRSSWWTVSHTEPSSSRWSRSSTARHRANTMDARTYSLQQRQRKNGKSVSDIMENDRQADSKNTSSAVISSATFSDANSESSVHSLSDLADLESLATSAGGRTSYSPSSDYTGVFTSQSLDLNSDSLLSSPAAPSGSDGRLENLTSLASLESCQFGLKRLSPVPSLPGFEPPSVLGEDDSSNIMITQLSPLAWSHCAETGSLDNVSPQEDGYAMLEDRLPDLFSDVAMSQEDAASLHCSQHNNNSLDEPVFCYELAEHSALGDRTVMLTNCSSSSSVELRLRRGSDAPPPSPESNGSDCGGPTTVLQDMVGPLASMRVEPADRCPTETSNWTSLFPLKQDDVSSASDMDMDH